MTFSQLLIRWLVMAALTIICGLLQGKKFGTNLLLVAALAASVLAGLAALHPLTKLPGVLGFGVGWLRHLLTFSLLAAVLTQYSPRRSLIMGLGFATLFTMYTLFRIG